MGVQHAGLHGNARAKCCNHTIFLCTSYELFLHNKKCSVNITAAAAAAATAVMIC